MCVFSVQKELENRQESKPHRAHDSRPKRLPRYTINAERKNSFQHKTEARLENPRHFKGQGVF